MITIIDYECGNLISLSPSISKPQVNETKVFKAIRLKDGGFAIGTVGKGLMLFDDKGKLLRSLNKSQGIINNTILSLYEDLDNNIWLKEEENIRKRYFEKFAIVEIIKSIQASPI